MRSSAIELRIEVAGKTQRQIAQVLAADGLGIARLAPSLDEQLEQPPGVETRMVLQDQHPALQRMGIQLGEQALGLGALAVEGEEALLLGDLAAGEDLAVVTTVAVPVEHRRDPLRQGAGPPAKEGQGPLATGLTGEQVLEQTLVLVGDSLDELPQQELMRMDLHHPPPRSVLGTSPGCSSGGTDPGRGSPATCRPDPCRLPRRSLPRDASTTGRSERSAPDRDEAAPGPPSTLDSDRPRIPA